jgi:hypothetical protein
LLGHVRACAQAASGRYDHRCYARHAHSRLRLALARSRRNGNAFEAAGHDLTMNIFLHCSTCAAKQNG